MAKYRNPGVDEVIGECRSYIHNEKQIDLIVKAANYAMSYHAGKFRKSGEPYFIHLTNVAYILATMHSQPTTVAAGFLHDVIEDCGVTHDQLAAEFGVEIADLVEAVTKVGMLKFKGKNDPEYQAANHRKIFIAMAKDVRVIIIKLVDRLHNMRTLQYQSAEAQKRISLETLDVYAPIAHRLGISAIKNELEDLSFFYLHRDKYYEIAERLNAKKTERDEAINKMIKEISDTLSSMDIHYRIFGRSKHLYSIYMKMQKKHKEFDEILDLLAIRIVTDTKQNCYEILGVIHEKYPPLSGRLKDYIAAPKTNMYQSLHTTVIGDGGKIFEVQIRTEDMDAIAERGIAAHWRYKEGTSYDPAQQQREIEDKLSWLKNLATYNEDEENEDPSGFMEMLQKDVFEANVYVMTPKGRVVELPEGSTPVDFAYRIHTEVGHQTVGAMVNGAIVPLNTVLHTGEVVYIKTQKGTGPSEGWLQFVKTNQARNKIRAYLQKKEAEEKEIRVPEGERILQEELTKRGFNPKDYMDKKKLEAVYRELRYTTYTDFMYGLAVRSTMPVTVVEKLTNQKRSLNGEEMLSVLDRQATHRVTKSGLIVPGISSMKMALSHCCFPVYGDKIVGYITKGEGVKVHRADCPNIRNMRNQFIDVQWDDGEADRLYDSEIVVIARDYNGLLLDVVTVMQQSRCTMDSVHADKNVETMISTIRLSIKVRDLNHLNQVMANIRKNDSVIEIRR